MSGITNIQTLDGDRLSIEASSPRVTILNGSNYEYKVSYINTSPSSYVKVTPYGVFVSDAAGSTITNLTLKSSNKTFYEQTP